MPSKYTRGTGSRRARQAMFLCDNLILVVTSQRAAGLPAEAQIRSRGEVAAAHSHHSDSAVYRPVPQTAKDPLRVGPPAPNTQETTVKTTTVTRRVAQTGCAGSVSTVILRQVMHQKSITTPRVIPREPKSLLQANITIDHRSQITEKDQKAVPKPCKSRQPAGAENPGPTRVISVSQFSQYKRGAGGGGSYVPIILSGRFKFVL